MWGKAPLLAPLLALASGVGASAPGPVLGNLVWHDLNRNGIQDSGEPGLNGIIVRAYNATNNVLLETQSTHNDGVSDGVFTFSFRSPVTIYLAVEPPLGFTFTLTRQGTSEILDSDIDPLTGRTPNISLDCTTPSKCIQTQWDAGLVRKLLESASKP